MGIKELQEKLKKIANPEKALKQIGISLVSSTKLRFNRGEDPEGKEWKERSEATKNILKSKGRLTNKTLVVTSNLQKSISYISDKNKVVVGTNVEYAKINNQGGKSKFRGRTVDIPKRQFLGVSKSDERQIDRVLKLHMEGKL